MQTTARVVARRGDKLRLSCETAAPCGPACACARGWFGWRRGGFLELEADGAPPGTGPGDRLLVSVQDGALLRAALRMYVPPVAGLILGAGLARWMAGDSAFWALLGSISGGALGLLFASRLLGRWAPPIRLQRAPDQG